MKWSKLLLTLMIAASMLISCKNEKKSGNSSQNETKAAVEMAEKSKSEKPAAPVKSEENLSGEVQVISEEQFIAMITDIDNPKGFQYKGSTPCIVDFYADWCHPCILLNPVLHEIAGEYKGRIIIYKVYVDKATAVAKAFNIQSIPALVFFKPNARPTAMVGAQPKEELVKAIETIFFAK